MNIFINDSDYQHFYKLIIKNLECEKFKWIKIISYCFLPNHFHFVINMTNRGIEDPNIISNFFWSIQNSYTKYFNKVYERKWQLYEWRFQANIIETEEYYHKCISYVALNPVKHNIVENIDDYKWSSYNQINKKMLEKYKNIELKVLEL